jgi:hypothetical protein
MMHVNPRLFVRCVNSQECADAALILDRARRAAIARADYPRAAELRLELAILIAMREATGAEIKSGEFFE